jgi:hypothetical protein
VVQGVRSAIATAFGGIVFGLSIVAYWAYQDGQTLDFHWFRIAGQAGAPAFLFSRHALTILPVGFLFSLVFWLFAGTQCWWLNERAHREALAEQRTASPPEASVAPLPAAAVFAVVLGEWLFLGFFCYLPLANRWSQFRLPPLSEELLFTAGLAGAALVWGVSFLAWLSSLGKALMSVVRGLFRLEPGQIPSLESLTHSTLGPVDPPGMDEAGPSRKRYRACGYAGASLLLAAFALSSPVGPFPGARLFGWLAYLGVGILLVGVGIAARAGYAELLKKSQAQPGHASAGASAKRAFVPAGLPYWAILLFAGLVFVVISILLGLW